MTLPATSQSLPLSIETPGQLAQTIDETFLTWPESLHPNEVETLLLERCEAALKLQFRAMCVRPVHVAFVKSLLKQSPLKIATVIGFPLQKMDLESERLHPTVGSVGRAEKLEEIAAVLKAGANELDIVMDVAQFIKASESAQYWQPEEDLRQFVQAAQGQATIKLILETDLLTAEQIVTATNLCCELGIDTVKTSTGMLEGGSGATVETIKLIYQTIQAHPNPIKPTIKASGGIRTTEQALLMIHAGAQILGSSNGAQLVLGFKAAQLK